MAKAPQRGAVLKLWTIFLLSLVSLAATVLAQKQTDPTERAALLAFRNALIDQDNVLNWTIGDPCSDSWAGVKCDPSVNDPRDPQGQYQHVIELRLLALNLAGKLVPELGNFRSLQTLDVMFNYMDGGIPAEIGNLANLSILALSGNRFSGTVPPDLGKLTNMNRIQLDENQFVGPVPGTFGNLRSLRHLHLNNNSFAGQVPGELGNLTNLIHILLDNNQLSGTLPPEISNASALVILQLDNNQFEGNIPVDYITKFKSLTKLSCRNCSLSGEIPDLSNLVELNVLDLSHNNFSGTIPKMFVDNITTIDLSHNQLVGQIPDFLVGVETLQKLMLGNNKLDGTIPDFASQVDYTKDMQLFDFQNNSFGLINLGLLGAQKAFAPNLSVWLAGNDDLCGQEIYIVELQTPCKPQLGSDFPSSGDMSDLPTGGPIVVTYRLKSPGFSFFTYGYQIDFEKYIANGLEIDANQVMVQSYEWQPGPRLLMILVINPPANTQFNSTEVERIQKKFANWDVKNSTKYGPYELLGFDFIGGKKSGLGKGAIAGIVVGALAVLAFMLVLLALLLVYRKRTELTPAQKRRAELRCLKSAQHSMLKITGVTAFTYKELAKATDDFSDANEVGRGGYGKVYRGVLQTGQAVAIKRANFEAIQRNTEFYNEIELLSRCHHRNLVALLGYCDDEEEQMLVYEFMQNGSLSEHLTAGDKPTLDFATRVRLALGSAKGILYLHTEANPPIFHRDIKSNNILLDDRRQAKVADFGLSRLAPDIDEASGEPSDHVSTVVKGTPGYLDPEYFLTRKLTDKSDVYSFGVVLLELITGMQPISYGKNLVREVKALYENGELLKVIDTKMGSYPAEVMEPFARLAVACVNNDTDSRPTMQEVTRTLETLSKELQGKGLKEMRSMDISRDDYSITTAPSFLDKSIGVGNGFATGSSQNSNDQTVSTSHFITVQENNDYLSPR